MEDTATEKRFETFSAWKTIASIVPIAVAIGYCMAYSHEIGFCSKFKIPIDLIEVDTTDILVAVSSVFISILFLGWVASMIYTYVKNRPADSRLGPIARRVVLLVIFSAIYAALAFIYPPAAKGWPVIVFFLAYYALLLFVAPIRAFKDKACYTEELKAQDEKERQTRIPLLDWLTGHIGAGGVLILIIVIYIISLSYFAGEAKATQQEYFFVPSSNQELVVLLMYGDNLICSSFDRETQEVQKDSVFVIRMGGEPATILRLERVGPLSLAE